MGFPDLHHGRLGILRESNLELARIELSNTRRRDCFAGERCLLLEMGLSRGKDGGPTSRTAKLGEPNHQITYTLNLLGRNCVDHKPCLLVMFHIPP